MCEGDDVLRPRMRPVEDVKEIIRKVVGVVSDDEVQVIMEGEVEQEEEEGAREGVGSTREENEEGNEEENEEDNEE